MKIKICGLFRLEDIEAVNEAMPDYVGFVFAESRRQVNAGMAKVLKARLHPGIQAVGVFVNPSMEEAAELYQSGVIDLIQLHGTEREDEIISLKKLADCPVIKAIKVVSAKDIIAAQTSPADYLLLDHGSGGTGESFDWNLIPALKKPFFLAGGIHAGNVTAALRSAAPYAVDLSSGVETDGYKDRNKIIEVVSIVRRTPDLMESGII